MKKEKVLEKNTIENKKKVYDREINKQALAYAAVVMGVLAGLFGIIEICVSDNTNNGFTAIVFSALTTTQWVRFIKLKEKRTILLALAATFLTLGACVRYIHGLM